MFKFANGLAVLFCPVGVLHFYEMVTVPAGAVPTVSPDS